jgi:hypothetical protein
LCRGNRRVQKDYLSRTTNGSFVVVIGYRFFFKLSISKGEYVLRNHFRWKKCSARHGALLFFLDKKRYICGWRLMGLVGDFVLYSFMNSFIDFIVHEL